MSNADALRTALERLVADGTLSPAQATRVADEVGLQSGPPEPAPPQPARQESARPEPARPEPEPARGAELAAYLGGTLLLGAVVLLFGQTWQDLPTSAKVAIAAVTTTGLLGAALVLGRERTARKQRLAGTLSLLGALAAGVTAGYLLDGDWETLVVGVVIALIAVPMYLRFAGVALVAGMFLGGLLVTVNLLDQLERDQPTAVVWGLGLVGYGACWLGIALSGRLPELGMAGFLGGLSGLAGAEIAAASDDWALLGLFLGVGLVAAEVTAFAVKRHPDLLVVGILTTLVVPPTALAQLFDDWLVAVGALLVIGAAGLLFGISSGVSMRRRTPR